MARIKGAMATRKRRKKVRATTAESTDFSRQLNKLL